MTFICYARGVLSAARGGCSRQGARVGLRGVNRSRTVGSQAEERAELKPATAECQEQAEGTGERRGDRAWEKAVARLMAGRWGGGKDCG